LSERFQGVVTLPRVIPLISGAFKGLNSRSRGRSEAGRITHGRVRNAWPAESKIAPDALPDAEPEWEATMR